MPDESATPDHLDLRSLDLTAERRDELLRLFPEVHTEGGQIDFERLRLALGEMVDTGKERYGLSWPGKADCFAAVQTPSMATLRPAPDESVHFDTTENLIIEGDNLEVLKLLQKSYLGKVKVIYIDPPYNTGNDFIYPDNYSESLQTYLEYTGQVDAEGKKFGSNTETDGRFHSRWLNMMWPRMLLARNLLRDDGLLFVSISDHEVSALRFILDQVFGEECFVSQLVWKSRKFPDSRAITGVSTDHEYVVLYKRSSWGSVRGIERDESKFTNPDNDPRGPWMSRSILGLATQAQRPNLHYEITDPSTGNRYPSPADTGWRYDAARMAILISQDAILFPSKPTGRPREKKFRSDLLSGRMAFPSIIDDVFTSDGTSEIRTLFGSDVFEFAKPSSLISRLVSQGLEQSDLVVDFFAGSGSTAHAVLNLNKADGGHRKFILVQLPEPTGREDYPTIAEITKERVRRVIAKLDAEDDGKLALENGPKPDRGFKVFKLAESNFTPWDAGVKDAAGLADQLRLQVDHVRDGRTDADLLYEIILKSGLQLTDPVETRTIASKAVHVVAGNELAVCLDRKLSLDLIRGIADIAPARVACLDAGFAGSDQLKANAVHLFKAKNIAFRTV